MTGAPLVLVTVGTDHHPFPRLVGWVQAWADGREPHAATCVVQHGTAPPPAFGRAHAYLPYHDLAALVGQAAAVVCHGGPATIMLARQLGITPIVVPRRADLGEHVDNHQVAFCARLAARGDIHLAGSASELAALLDAAVADPLTYRFTAETAGVDATVRCFGELVAELFAPVPAWRLLYVGGWGRSGSTLLARLLGQVDGVVAVGELRDLLLRGCVEDRLCGCGQPFYRCPLWRAVGAAAFGGWEQVDLARLLRIRATLDRPWMMPLLAAGRGGGRAGTDLATYVGMLRALYEALAEVTGAAVVVDSSKIASYALLLRRALPGQVRVAHLVRDSRGVVHSWQKEVELPDDPGRRTVMLRYGSAGAALRYDVYNAVTHGLPLLGLPTLRLRYEDLVAEPTATLTAILRHAGRPVRPGDLDFIGADGVTLSADHTVDGNPMRFTDGPLRLRVDEAWRTAMPPARQRAVAVMTGPLLARYGYPLRRPVDGA